MGNPPCVKYTIPKARMIWVECAEDAPGAEPWLGVRYKPEPSSVSAPRKDSDERL